MTQNIRMPNGDIVGFPDDMPKDQIQGMINKKFPDAQSQAETAHLEETPWGRISSGTLHGLETPIAEGMRMFGKEPWQGYRAYEQEQKTNPSELRDWSETIAGAVPSMAVKTVGAVPTAIAGGTIGALNPAKDWKERATNAVSGALMAELGPIAGVALKHPRILEGINHLVNDAAGIASGHHFYGLPGALGGLATGEMLNWRTHNWLPSGGLTGLLARIARNNPGLAAYLGVKADPSQALPYAKQTYDWATTPDTGGPNGQAK